MEYIEIILEDIPKRNLDKIIREVLKIDTCNIISSHFFDNKNNKDIVYQDIDNLENYFCEPGTCNLFLDEVEIGIKLKKVIIIISCNEKVGDITINFSENQCENESTRRVKKLLLILFDAKKRYSINNIIIGYEPAIDDNMKMFEIYQDTFKICNEGILQSAFAQCLYYTLREINQ